MEPTETPITSEQAAFVEEKTKEMFDYTIECFDRAHTDGNNVLQWLFGVITGGMAIIGALWVKGYFLLAFGFGFTVCAAAFAAIKLVRALRSRETMPPGNLAGALNTILNDTLPRMRWREAKGMDDRIEKNRLEVESLATAVDNARIRLASIPAWFIGGVIITYAIKFFFFSL